MSGLPLNINWQQICLHLFNFFLLALGLYILIYVPVVKFMEKRKMHYASLDEETQLNLENAKSIKAQHEMKLNQANQEIENIKTEVMKNANAAALEKVEEARQQGERIIADAKVAAQFEKEKTLEESRQDVKQMVKDAIKKMVVKDQESLIDDFMNHTKEARHE